jgi:hypothetical protein
MKAPSNKLQTKHIGYCNWENNEKQNTTVCHTVGTVSMPHCRNSFTATLSEQFQCHTVRTVSIPHCWNSFNATLSEQFQCHTVGTVSMSHCRNSFNATLSEQFQCHTVGTVSMPHCRNSFNILKRTLRNRGKIRLSWLDSHCNKKWRG